MSREETRQNFNEILAARNSELAWNFFELDFSTFTDDEYVEMAILLFDEDWHSIHDQLASTFQKLRNPLAEDILFKNTFRKELEIDDYKPMARKCTWALADIGTPTAKAYLEKIAGSGDAILEGYARKRLDNWEKEIPRKGRRLSIPGRSFKAGISLDRYEIVEPQLPQQGRHLVAHQSEEDIIVYQAYKPTIAEFAVQHQCLGGKDFSYERMSWIKPNFLWMMYRCGWASKKDQERVLAISISKKDFEEILSQSVWSSFQSSFYVSRQAWQEELRIKQVRIQWDPHHDPYGYKQERRDIQIGMKGNVLKKFGQHQINYIADITDFVKKQSMYIDRKELGRLLMPIETLYPIKDRQLALRLGVDTA